MAAAAFAVFDTAVGPCAVAWHDTALVGVELPSGTEASTRAACERRWSSAVEIEPGASDLPAMVRDAISRIGVLVAGTPADFSGVPLDFSEVPSFHQRVYDVTRAIPPGRTQTYGEIAAQVGDAGAARAVGQALGRNPFPLIIPCHRVLAAGGGAGGFSGAGGVATKRRLLAIEGAVPAQGTLPGF